MSLKSIVNKARESRGFTIVELLIVIVVIGILATITIVAYNNVTDRAKTSSAQAAAKTVANKAAVYQAEIGSYPDALEDLTGAASNTSYNIPSGSIVSVAAPTAASDPQTIIFYTCGDNDNGVAVGYYDYAAGALVEDDTTTYTVGDVSGTCTAVATPTP
ncbi:MAG TPA: prepilin-type N-terminal cleavage/methylation domain-containing protein [Candidatus Saccharibacteria bacterium]|nr:prepilin-type N-terminal cleavage/methylation domain-containing protein [Candidatus Saccharibacteria bacterium]